MTSILHLPSSTFIPGEHEYALQQAKLLSQVSAAIASFASFISNDAIKNIIHGRECDAKTVKRVRTDMESYIG